jgi:sigma-B regulation protein RsbQ
MLVHARPAPRLGSAFAAEWPLPLPPHPCQSAFMNILHRNKVSVRGTSGPTLIYAHGFGCNQQMWDAITPAFDLTHRQVLFDYVGSGQSDISAFDPTRYSSLHGYAQDLIEVCDALGLAEGVHFVGHSVSCSIGLLASLQRPGLFKSLVLVGPSPCFLNDPPDYLGGFEREDLEGLLMLMDQNYIGWAQTLGGVVAGAEEPGVARTLTDSFCSTEPSVARVFARTTFFSDNRPDLPLVQAPCLILQHRHDALAPLGVGDYLHAQLRASQLEVLDVAGHCAHMSHPQLVIDAMKRFLHVEPSGTPCKA